MNTPIITRDLSKEPPHSPRDRVAQFVIVKRAVDKCRASIAGTPGEYLYDCPLDNLLFSFKGITSAEFQTAVRDSTRYEEVGAWLQASGTPKTAAEIKSWSDETEAANPMRNPEKRSFFIQSCSVLGLNPRMNSTFDWLEADDRETFRPKPGQPAKQKNLLAAASVSNNGHHQ
jgi:hypothetical protein